MTDLFNRELFTRHPLTKYNPADRRYRDFDRYIIREERLSRYVETTCEYLVIHMAPEYTPCVTFLYETELEEYFTEDYGWDGSTIALVEQAELNETISVSSPLGKTILIVRIS